jgi:hypothetical protein
MILDMVNYDMKKKHVIPNLDKPEPKRKKSVNLGYENINGNLQRKNKLNAFLL